jgi:hypothetical protein
MAQSPNSEQSPKISDQMRENRERHLFPILRRLGALGALALAGIGAHAVYERNANPVDFSNETKQHTVKPGEGLYNAAYDVEGSETTDLGVVVDHIAHDPANIEVLKDGLQPGESVIIPKSAKSR